MKGSGVGEVDESMKRLQDAMPNNVDYFLADSPEFYDHLYSPCTVGTFYLRWAARQGCEKALRQHILFVIFIAKP